MDLPSDDSDNNKANSETTDDNDYASFVTASEDEDDLDDGLDDDPSEDDSNKEGNYNEPRVSWSGRPIRNPKFSSLNRDYEYSDWKNKKKQVIVDSGVSYID